MAIRSNREYRAIPFEIRKAGEDSEDYKVTGYASTYEPYMLWEDGDTKFIEKIDERAFDESDISDVIFLYNHEGMVYARQKNGTLNVSVDEHGLKIEADLSSTEMSKQIYEQIRSGLIDEMSFAFTVKEDSIDYDRDSKTYTRTIKKVGKVYDVSAVSIPANPDTDISAISARSWIDGVIKKETAERLENEKRLALAKAKYNYMEV